MIHNMTFPIVNGTGTPALELVEQNTDVLYAVKAAMEALESAAPQVRDYFQKGMHFYDAALREHKDRLERMRSVRDETQVLLEHINLAMK